MAIRLTIGLLLLGVLSTLFLFVIDDIWGDAAAQWSSMVFIMILGLVTTIATIMIAKSR